MEPALLFINDFAFTSLEAEPVLCRRCTTLAEAPCSASIAISDSPIDKRPFKTHVGIHFLHASGKDAHAPVFYLHFEPDNCFAAAGIWRPDNRALTGVRSAIVKEPERWAMIRKKLELEGDSLSRPPRGFDPKHPFVDDLKRKSFMTSVAFDEADICSKKFMREFSAACRNMSPLVEFTTKALGLKY